MIEIILAHGHGTAIVDDIDADLSELRWTGQTGQKQRGVYATRYFTKAQHRATGDWQEFLHRVVLSRKLGRPLLKSEKVDHINRNKLDCRRSNLRIASNAQNAVNIGNPAKTNTGYCCIWKHVLKDGTERYFVRVGGKYLGRFNSLRIAVAVRNEAYRTRYGRQFAQSVLERDRPS